MVLETATEGLKPKVPGPKPMISLSFRWPSRDATIDPLYGMIVAQARSPEFYTQYGVPDTVEGRLDMIVLHLVLVLRAMRQGQGVSPQAAQHLFDRFCRDIDGNFREMGVGDLAVPKRMQKVGEAFYGRAQAYEAALQDSSEDQLVGAVARNIYGSDEPTLRARRLATYIRTTAACLEAADLAMLSAGRFKFPKPEQVPQPNIETLN